jgi:hypothetical protein
MAEAQSVIVTTPAIVGGKALALHYTNRAQYRLQSHGLVSDLADIFDEKKRVAGLCNWLWAMDDLSAYASPEAVADAISTPEIVAAMDAILAAFRVAHPETAAAKPPPTPTQKKDSAAEQAAASRIELGLTAEEWLATTPVEISALWRAWREKQEREDLRWARLTYHVAAPHLPAGVTVDDFRTFLPAEKRRTPPTADEQWRALQLAFPQQPETTALQP